MEKADQMECPACHKRYRWNHNTSGRKVKCKACDAVFLMPDEAKAKVELVRQPHIIPLDDPDKKPKNKERSARRAQSGPTRPCPACNAPMPEAAVICIGCGFNVKDGKKMKTAVAGGTKWKAAKKANGANADKERNNPSKDFGVVGSVGASSAVQKKLGSGGDDNDAKTKLFVLPLIFIGAGLALVLLDVFLCFDASMQVNASKINIGTGQQAPPAPAATTTELVDARLGRLTVAGILFAVHIPFFVVGMFVVARLFGTSFEPIGAALLQVTASALMCLGVYTCVDSLVIRMTEGLPVPGTAMFKFPFLLGTFAAMAMGLLDLDFIEALVYFLTCFFLPVVLLVLFAFVFGVMVF